MNVVRNQTPISTKQLCLNFFIDYTKSKYEFQVLMERNKLVSLVSGNSIKNLSE